MDPEPLSFRNLTSGSASILSTESSFSKTLSRDIPSSRNVPMYSTGSTLRRALLSPGLSSSSSDQDSMEKGESTKTNSDSPNLSSTDRSVKSFVIRGLYEIQDKRVEYLQRRTTKFEKDFFEYKRNIKCIKLELKIQNDLVNSINPKKIDFFKLEQHHLELLRNQLYKAKQQHPGKIEAAKIVYQQVIFDNPSVKNCSCSASYEKTINRKVFLVKKNKAIKIDFGKEGFFVISKGRPGDPKVIAIAMRTKMFAEGHFGTLYDVLYLHHQKKGFPIGSKVMKIAKHGRDADKIISNESRILDELGNIKGIQSKPDTIFKGGYITDKLDGDGLTLFFTISKTYTDKEKMRLTHTLINALRSLHSKRVFHGDIKPENMLYFDKSGKTQIILSDFGGARNFLELLNPNALPKSAYELYNCFTSVYFSYSIFLEIDKIITATHELIKDLETGDKLKHIKDCNTNVEILLKKSDEFALGLTLYCLWKNDYPNLLCFEEEDYCTINTLEMQGLIFDLKFKKVPEEVVSIIEKMLTPGLEQGVSNKNDD